MVIGSRPLPRVLAALGVAFCAALVLAMPAHAAFPGANGLIAYESDATGTFEIWTIRSHGSEQTQLTTCRGTEAFGCTQPRFSPDGKRIVYSYLTPDDAQVRVMNADGSDPRTVLTTPEGEYAYDPTFSANGHQITFTRDDGSCSGSCTWSMSADGAEPTELPAPGRINHYPTYSPDGSQIAYMSTATGNNEDIWIMNADGSDPHQLTFNQRSTGENPDLVRLAWLARGGALRVQVGCSLERCKGELVLHWRGHQVGRADYELAVGEVRGVDIPLAARTARCCDARAGSGCGPALLGRP